MAPSLVLPTRPPAHAGEHQLRLGWLDELPHSSELCAHLCLKGMSCGSEAVRRGIDGLRRMRVHSCVEEPGGHENGHEGVCAYRFLLDNYEAPWSTSSSSTATW